MEPKGLKFKQNFKRKHKKLLKKVSNGKHIVQSYSKEGKQCKGKLPRSIFL